jgi:predicted DNA-binding transcriptional regulator AlpA
MQDDELLDEAATCRFFGGTKPINPATLWRGVKKGRYSKPIRISDQAVRWRRSELQDDIDRMVAERDADEAAA